MKMITPPRFSTLSMPWRLLIAAAVTSSVVNGLENGLCTAEFCTCMLSFPSSNDTDFEPPPCPTWMATKSDGGTYDILSSGSCIPSTGSMGILTCQATADSSSLFEDIPVSFTATVNSPDPGSNNETSTCLLTSWTITDGDDGPTIVNYTALDQPPSCGTMMDIPPFASLPPSMAPTAEGEATTSSGSTFSIGIMTTPMVIITGMIWTWMVAA